MSESKAFVEFYTQPQGEEFPPYTREGIREAFYRCWKASRAALTAGAEVGEVERAIADLRNRADQAVNPTGTSETLEEWIKANPYPAPCGCGWCRLEGGSRCAKRGDWIRKRDRVYPPSQQIICSARTAREYADLLDTERARAAALAGGVERLTELLTEIKTPIRCMCGRCEPIDNVLLLWESMCLTAQRAAKADEALATVTAERDEREQERDEARQFIADGWHESDGELPWIDSRTEFGPVPGGAIKLGEAAAFTRGAEAMTAERDYWQHQHQALSSGEHSSCTCPGCQAFTPEPEKPADCAGGE